jgi:rod shape-determining protein MreD
VQSLTIIFVAFLMLVIQSTFAHFVPLDILVPSLSFPIVLYMSLHDYATPQGVLVSFVIGYLMDTFAGSPMGLHTFVTVAIFLFSKMATLKLFLQGWIFEILLTFFLAILSSLLILTIRAVFDEDFSSLLIHLKIVTFRACATAIVAPLIFRLMNKVEKIAPRRKGEGSFRRG